MSYRSSRARKEFEAQLQVALRELRPLHKAALTSGGGGAARLLGAYYVFAFAQFEVYIKSLVEDSLATVVAVAPPFHKWPDLMVAYVVHRGDDLGADYRRYGVNDDEGALLAKLASTAKKIASWADGGPLPVAVDSSQFLDKKKYPSPRNFPQLFKRLGVVQVWAVVNAAGRMNGELVLTSLNDLRTDIAHEGKVPAGFGYADFRERIGKMERFVAAVDRGVSKQFCTTMMTRTDWNQAMT